MYSKWKIFAFSGMGVMFGMIGLVGILGDKSNIQESEMEPLGIFYTYDLNLSAKGNFSKKMSWYSEVINVSISANDSNWPLEAFVKTMDGDIIWSSKFAGEIKDSFLVVPGKAYTTTILNQKDETIRGVHYSFETAYFEDKDGNFVITKHAQLYLILVGVGVGLTMLVVGGTKMQRKGEKWEW